MEDDRGMTLHHFLNGKTVWQNGQLDAHTLMHRYSSVDRKTAVARTEYSVIASPLSPSELHSVHTHTHKHAHAMFCILCVFELAR